jgi:hypothetical protein
VGRLKSNSIARMTPGKYGDGDGLYLHVKPSGRRTFSFKFMRHGKAGELGLVLTPPCRWPRLGKRRSSYAATWPSDGKSALHLCDYLHERCKGLPRRAEPVLAQRQTRGAIGGDMPWDTCPCGLRDRTVLAIRAPISAVKNETASRVRGRIARTPAGRDEPGHLARPSREAVAKEIEDGAGSPPCGSRFLADEGFVSRLTSEGEAARALRSRS